MRYDELSWSSHAGGRVDRGLDRHGMGRRTSTQQPENRDAGASPKSQEVELLQEEEIELSHHDSQFHRAKRGGP
jgi:hypothetical protein